jgi:hypothetical protein
MGGENGHLLAGGNHLTTVVTDGGTPRVGRFQQDQNSPSKASCDAHRESE